MSNNGTVIRVGEGRGFFIATEEARFVVTAALCLPKLPPAHPAAYTHERTYADFLGPLGGPRDVWAECVFVDPVADLAVLCQPDGQALSDHADAYDRLSEEASPFPLGKLPPHRPTPDQMFAVREARMFSLDGEWFACRFMRPRHGLVIEDPAQPIQPGMSGSPIILPDGSAIGVVCTGTDGPHPALFAQLPAWLVHEAS